MLEIERIRWVTHTELLERTPMRFIGAASAADQLPLFVIFELVEDGHAPDGPVDPSTANDSKVSRCRLSHSTQVSSSAANTQAVRQPPAAARLRSVVTRRASRSCARTASRSPSSSTSTALASNAALIENLDVEALVALMTDDAWVRMPPLPFEYRGTVRRTASSPRPTRTGGESPGWCPSGRTASPRGASMSVTRLPVACIWWASS